MDDIDKIAMLDSNLKLLAYTITFALRQFRCHPCKIFVVLVDAQVQRPLDWIVDTLNDPTMRIFDEERHRDEHRPDPPDRRVFTLKPGTGVVVSGSIDYLNNGLPS